MIKQSTIFSFLDSKFNGTLEMGLPSVISNGMTCMVLKIYHNRDFVMQFLYYFETNRTSYQVDVHLLTELSSWFDTTLYESENVVGDWVSSKLPHLEQWKPVMKAHYAAGV